MQVCKADFQGAFKQKRVSAFTRPARNAETILLADGVMMDPTQDWAFVCLVAMRVSFCRLWERFPLLNADF